MSDKSLDPSLLSAAFDALPLGVLITDPNGCSVWWNSGFTAFENRLPASIQTAIASGQAWRGETLWGLIQTEVTVAGLDSDHRIVTVRALSDKPHDVVECCRLLAENSVDVIWLWSVAGNRFEFVSPSVERLRGFTAEEALAQSFEQTLTPDSRARAMACAQASAAAVEAGDESRRIRVNDLEMRRKDGSVVATETVTRMVTDTQGKVTHILGISRDVGERNAEFQLLRAAEEKYRSIFDGALEGIYRTSVDGRLLAVNAAAAAMYGYDSVEDFLTSVGNVGTEVWVDPEERVRFIQLLMDQGTVRNYECQHRRKDGRAIWIAVNARRVHGPDGEPLYSEGFIEDISERKRMEDALRQSEEKFYRAFMSSPALKSIHLIREDGRILDVNESFERVTGYSRDEVIGRTVKELGLIPDESIELEIVRRLLGEGTVRYLEHPLRIKSGEIRTVLLSSDRIELEGRACAISARFDITERKRAEERIESLATAIEQAGEQVVITGLDGTIQYCNPAFEKTSGYSREEVLGGNPRILKSGLQPPEFYHGLWSTITAGSVWYGRFTNRRRDGALYHEEATISPVRDGAGQIKAYVAVKRDISERVHLENQLRQAQKLESVGRLAGGVAHDFNNLLTIINGYADLLLSKLKERDPLREYAEEVRNAGQRAVGLTRQLLAFSRKQVFEVRRLDVNAIVHDSERMLQRLIGEDIRLVTDLDPFAGLVMGDLDQLHQVIMNLAINARDAMPDGGRLTIETRNTQVKAGPASHPDIGPGSYVLVNISDTGTGMDEKTLESIFEPFFTTKEPGKGTGLGLATVYGIVRQNKGWVEVATEVGRGTAFRIYLPRVGGDDLPHSPVQIAPTAVRGGETVLVVEDQREVRALTSMILKSLGYRVLEAANGAEAGVVAGEYAGEIDLLLTDVVMPGINGKDLSERLRQSRPEMKVLFISGYTADVIADRGVLEPDVAYLPKPFSPESLAAKIREVLLP